MPGIVFLVIRNALPIFVTKSAGYYAAWQILVLLSLSKAFGDQCLVDLKLKGLQSNTKGCLTLFRPCYDLVITLFAACDLTTLLERVLTALRSFI